MGDYRPWRELRQLDDVDYELGTLPDGIRALLITDGETTVIVINRTLDPVDRLAALAHELVHLERGGGCHHAGMPAAWGAIAAREEQRVDEEVAALLVPDQNLLDLIAQRSEIEPITARLVADELDVSEPYALRALERVRRESA